MQTIPLQLNDVIYNPANQMFEALVTVHDQTGTRRYACAIDAPIDMEFEDAAAGLATQAMRHHARGHQGSFLKPVVVEQRAGRPTLPRKIQTEALHAETAKAA